ncbi:ABC transporter substrate-binding protein [Neptunomonas antarctica]|uniref:ABC-type uncharacterized transport system, substrate-binding protein n=1 Tax=Neptunomonas antarctica TaxID=619304 RepID=A0A1N7IYL1_9GAMM|nr:ABC transporter substrate binding protein [Neptunomonas antarctica]SIS42076.1 ABC-type uncharacterized transport system, substrate-binding protein [Neptunomonas antarctica]
MLSLRFAHIIHITLLLFLVSGASASYGANRILVVMSYEENFYWSQEVKRGIEQVLAADNELHYFYMNTKTDFKGGAAKAQEAYELFQSIKPDGVITVDDNAQSMFVVPYLRDKTRTPIMFCGVNAPAAQYGYPNQHISGILERGHIRESLAFAKQLSPAIQSVGFVTFDSPTGNAMMAQIRNEADSYPVNICVTRIVRSVSELEQVASQSEQSCDALYLESMGGIQDGQGQPMDYQAVSDRVRSYFHSPLLGGNRIHVESGALSAVIKTGEEQGQTAAEMLLKAIETGDVTSLPVIQNFRGHRIINVTTLRQFNLKPNPIVLSSAELITSEPDR